MDKSDLRREIRRKIKELPNKEKLSAAICRRLSSAPEFKNADVILSFCPMKDEPDITPLFDDRFLFPFIRDNEMFFGRAPLEKSSMGFLEPVDKTEVPYGKALILVPGMAFTKDGKRLGRGGGFYDKYLSLNKEKLHSVALCFPVQLVDSIPVEEHDEPVDSIITSY